MKAQQEAETPSSAAEAGAPSSAPVHTVPRARREIPGPRGLPFLGIAPQLGSDILGTVVGLMREYGEVVRVPAPFGMRGVLVNDPELIKVILTESEKNFVKPAVTHRRLASAIGEGLVTSNGPYWKRQRRLVTPAFHRESIAGAERVIHEETSAMLARWEPAAREGRDVDVKAEMMRLMLRISVSSLFSTGVSDADSDTLQRGLEGVMDYFAANLFSPLPLPMTFPTPLNRRALKGKRQVYAILERVITERRRVEEAQRPKDLLSMLMGAVDAETGERMGDAEVRDEVLSFFFAAIDTTANTLAFALHTLGQHAEVRRKLEAELASVLGDQHPTMAGLPQLPYTRATLEETMRLLPAVPLFTRCTVVDVEHEGFLLPKDTLLYLSPYASGRNPRMWTNPEAFDPERFNPERGEPRHKFAFYPFGGGPRMCIGTTFARTEMGLVLGRVLQRFRLEPLRDAPFKLKTAITLTSEPGIRMALHAR